MDSFTLWFNCNFFVLYNKTKMKMKTTKLWVFLLVVVAMTISCKSENKKDETKKEEVKKEESKEVTLTDAEMEKAKKIFFNTCAGCHGTTRKGATGPSLLPDGDGKFASTKSFGTDGLVSIITNGLPGGMPDWGKQGILSPDEVRLMAKFIQLPPPPVPKYTMDEVKKSWKLIIPVADRPTKPMTKRNWKNFFGVVLRDAGKVAIFDGDTKEKVTVLNTGFAVHILRTSSSGRYFYSIGRDGKVTLIDLWMETPKIVAEAKASFDARSVEVSKYNGSKGNFKDKYIIVGGYTPSHYVVFDAMTLKPLKLVKTDGKVLGKGEYREEARVASIVASHKDPIWVVNVKETGMVYLVDYSDLDKIDENTAKIPTAQFLHDGGWDHSGKYFLVAANAVNKIVVIDVENKKLETIIDVGVKPHPGRGTNIHNKKHGWMWVTGHIGEGKITCIATDKGPNQWKVVKNIKMEGSGGGNLFVKSHPNSKHLWADRALNTQVKLQRSIYVYDTETLDLVKTLKVPEKYKGRAVHMEYNKAGDEVWVSCWGKKDETTSAVLIYNDKTLELKHVIDGDWLVTPTGKFNVYNTAHDIY